MTPGIKTAKVARINGFNISLGPVDEMAQPVVTTDYLDNLTFGKVKRNTLDGSTSGYCPLDSTSSRGDSENLTRNEGRRWGQCGWPCGRGAAPRSAPSTSSPASPQSARMRPWA